MKTLTWRELAYSTNHTFFLAAGHAVVRGRRVHDI